jgi:Na+:H+ antiporter
MNADLIIGYVGAFLLVGFLAEFIFRKTGIPDVLLLIGAGFVATHVLHIVDAVQLKPLTSLVSAFTLVIILFVAGLSLKVTSNLPASILRAAALSILHPEMCALIGFLVGHYLLGWGAVESILLGLSLGSTGTPVITGLLARSSLDERARNVLFLESVLSDATVIVPALYLLGTFTQGGSQPSLSGIPGIATNIVISVVYGAAVGAIGGVFWSWVLSLLKKGFMVDIFTLGFLFILYFVVERTNGSGPLFALAFGVMITNNPLANRIFRQRQGEDVAVLNPVFHSQLNFAMKTFFFAYMGVIVTYSGPYPLFMGALLTTALLGGRFLVMRIIVIHSKPLKDNLAILTTLFGKGIAASLLASVALSLGIPHGADYVDIVMTSVVLSVLVSSVAVFVYNLRHKEKAVPE